MRLCPQGHENPDDAQRCSVCYQRIGAEEAVLMFVGGPTEPLPARSGSRLDVPLQLLMAGPSEATCSISVAGNAAAWVQGGSRAIEVEADQPTPVGLVVAVPSNAAAAAYSITVSADVEGGTGQAASAEVVFAVAATPRAATTAPQPAPEVAPVAATPQLAAPAAVASPSSGSGARPRSRAVIPAVVAAVAVVAVVAVVGGIVVWLLTEGPSLSLRVSTDSASPGSSIFFEGEVDPPTGGITSKVLESRDGGPEVEFGFDPPFTCCTTREDGTFGPFTIVQNNPGEYCFRLQTLEPVEDEILESNAACVMYE